MILLKFFKFKRKLLDMKIITAPLISTTTKKAVDKPKGPFGKMVSFVKTLVGKLSSLFETTDDDDAFDCCGGDYWINKIGHE
jgi:hypothetical protein